MQKIFITIRYYFIFLLCLLLTACGPDEFGILWRPSTTGEIMIGTKTGHHYFISGDEPYAVLVGNKIFLEGGNAIDAAVATAIATAATQPLSSSLGAGGACQGLAPGDDGTLTPFAISFLGSNPTDSMVAVLYQLQTRHGRLRWEKMVAPAEKLLRLGFAHNAATQLQTNNPFWQKGDNLTATADSNPKPSPGIWQGLKKLFGGKDNETPPAPVQTADQNKGPEVITNPELVNSLSTLRLRPLSFIFGDKDGTMNGAYQAAGLGYTGKMSVDDAMKTFVLQPFATMPKQKFANGLVVTLPKNQSMTGYGQGWVNYMASLVGDDSAPKKKLPQPARAGTGVMESSVMAMDETGRALSCHFAVQSSADTPPVRVGNLGFFAPPDGLRAIAARGFFITNGAGAPVGLVSLGQSARGVICRAPLADLADNVFNGDRCQWVLSETGTGLAIKGTR